MRKGFTLIELLVVIAIIAILAALLFPVFVKARDSAKNTMCGSHGKEIGRACMMYMDDWDGRFPSEASAAAIAALGTNVYNWANLGDRPFGLALAQYRFIQLKHYVRGQQAWICPNPWGWYGKRYAFGYLCSWLPRDNDSWDDKARRYDGFLDGDRGFQDKNGAGRTPAEVEALDRDPANDCGRRNLPPTKKILWMCYALGEWAIGRVGNPDWPKNTFPYYPHNGGTTYVYVDGHAKWAKTGKAWAPIGYTNLWMDEAPTKVY